MAASDVRVLDSSLGRKVSNMGPTDLVVLDSFTIRDIAAKILALARPNRIGRLTVICHGFAMMAYGDVYPKTGQRLSLPNPANKLVCRVYGGYGLELGKQGLDLGTVGDFSLLKGNFDPNGLIIICGCAAADTGPTHTVASGATLTGDGPALMKKLAVVTGAPVVAAVQLQTVVQNWYLGTADRGPFIGPTYLFKPDGSQTLNAASY
jgi:hypothetical protein